MNLIFQISPLGSGQGRIWGSDSRLEEADAGPQSGGKGQKGSGRAAPKGTGREEAPVDPRLEAPPTPAQRRVRQSSSSYFLFLLIKTLSGWVQVTQDESNNGGDGRDEGRGQIFTT